ncbi:type II toxin-antitoxin system death-on-curing family toxin [Methyloglobulus sp.]|uniref:type II toxin-antitoxin system death-on-curing family toxin n=1 Tax=Methyloglobulus sp. TaxID=2518622 RepID=UPI0032B76AF8
MTEVVWLLHETVLAMHEEQLSEHGGGIGVRDHGLLESALMRPQQLAHYGNADIAHLAAAYGFGLAKNHPFIDGNKRVAFAVTETFLVLNGVMLTATDEDCVTTMLQLAAGEIDENQFADWIRGNV